MIDWTVCLRLLTTPILILCGYRLLPPKAPALDASVWDAYVAARREHRPVSTSIEAGRHRAAVRVYCRPRTRPSRHSFEYFAARDTDTAELPVIRSD